MRERIVSPVGNNHLMMSGGRYPALRTIGILYLIGAAVSLIAGICYMAYVLVWGGPANWTFRLTNAAYVLGATFVSFIAFLAVAEFLKLAMDVARDLRILASTTRATTTVATPPVPPPLPASDETSTVVVEPLADGRENRIAEYLDDETAEAALMRGH
jgi:hypothetical protein